MRTVRVPRVLAAAGAVFLLGTGAAAATVLAGTPQDITCTVTDSVLSCPLPAAPTVTATETTTSTVTASPVTSTVTAAPVTSTVTAPPVTSTVTAPPVTSTTTVTAPPQTVTTTVTATPSPTTTTTPPPAPVQPAIGRVGNTLSRANVEWRAVGFNLPNIMGCNTADTSAATDTRLDQFFSGLPAHSLTRIWPYASSQWQTIMPRVVKSAEKYGQYLLPVLSDKNASGTQCGSNLGTTPYPADGGAVKTHATNVVTMFKDSPSIAMWEVVNEGDYDAADKPFYAAVVAEIRRIDPYAVVGYGVKTCYYAVGTATWNQCKDTMGQPSNDFIDFHEYDKGPGVSGWTDEHQRIAADTGKPWIVGEFGYTGGTCNCQGKPDGFTSFDASTADLLKQEWTNYLNAGASSVLYWSSVLMTNNTAFDQISPSKAAWPGVGTYTQQWQGN